MTAERMCVYTALFGNYGRLNSQPMAGNGDIDWICFTDDSELTSDDWEVVVIEPSFPLDPARSARKIKILPPAQVREYGVSLWIDNSVIMNADPRAMVSKWLQNDDIAFPSHSFRSTVLDEFFVVLDDELDDPSRILEQLEHYARTRPESLERQPFWNAIVPRRWTPLVDEAMHVWWEQVLRYSRRDQLSLNHVLDSVGLVPRRVQIDNFESEWHHWPVAPERNRAMRLRSADSAFCCPLARVFELEREMVRLKGQLGDSLDDIDELRSELDATRGREVDNERARSAAELRLAYALDVELPVVKAERDEYRERLGEAHRRLENAVGEVARLQLANTDIHRVHDELSR